MNACELEIGRPKSQGLDDYNNGWLCSANVVPAYKEYLYENSVGYWCSLRDYDIELKVAKNCPSGEKITRGIQQQVAPSTMLDILLSISIPYLDVIKFIDIIAFVRAKACNDGQNSLRTALQELLEPK